MSGINASFDDDPAFYDAMRACWLNDRREAFIRDRLEQTASGTSHSVVEFGSGTGWLLNRLATRFPNWTFRGVEPIQGYVDFATDRCHLENLQFVNGTAENASQILQEASFDFLLSNDVLHHVTSERDAVIQAARLARPGARWIAIEPNALNPYAFAGQALKSGERNFRPWKFIPQARQAGWQLKKRDYLFLVPPFIRKPPDWLKGMEKMLEGIPVIGGGVALELVYHPDKG